MLDKIIQMIIEEAQSRQDKDISTTLLEVQMQITKIIGRLSFHIAGIQHLQISEEQKRIFINHILEHPIY